MYLWMKWLHIIAVISWMAGILYLYRLLINHKERGLKSREVHELLVLMEYRLDRYITIPAMLVSIVAGLVMITLVPEMLSTGWMQVKLACVALLIVATLKAGHLRIRASVDANSLPGGRALRFANEVPTILMMIIVGMVVFKAF
ncbi:MAG: CopD family protein [Proteobacteria bacterium]|nr:CopD family protein [Pseudomonadota bacterium]